jgi:hypothetical protein
MPDHDITPEREQVQPDPDEHPGEDGAFVDPAGTRIKRRDPEGERLAENHVPHESDADEHQSDARALAARHAPAARRRASSSERPAA